MELLQKRYGAVSLGVNSKIVLASDGLLGISDGNRAIELVGQKKSAKDLVSMGATRDNVTVLLASASVRKTRSGI